MSLIDYASLQASVATWLQRTDLTATIPDFITLFESFANRKLRVRQQEAYTLLTPVSTVAVTGAIASPAGLVRLTVASIASLPIFQRDTVTVAAVVGTTEANGSFPLSAISATTIDLVGSTFANAYVSGGTLTATGAANLPSDYLAWRRLTWRGSPVRDLNYVEPSWFQQAYASAPTDRPLVFTVEGAVLRIMPLDPTPLTLLYYAKIPSLAANSTNWLMTEHPDLYLFGTLVEAQAYAVNADTAALWKARRDELIEEIITLSNRTRGAGQIRTMSPTP